MILIPMDDARQWHFIDKLSKGKPAPNSFKAQFFSSFAYAEQRNSVFRYKATFA